MMRDRRGRRRRPAAVSAVVWACWSVGMSIISAASRAASVSRMTGADFPMSDHGADDQDEQQDQVHNHNGAKAAVSSDTVAFLSMTMKASGFHAKNQRKTPLFMSVREHAKHAEHDQRADEQQQVVGDALAVATKQEHLPDGREKRVRRKTP